MGANAQTTVPTFTASQVLTADQQNQSARTGVPVFASTVTRDAAFGGTGEKTLAEGQLCYIEGTGLQTYNGSSWVTWGATPATSKVVQIVSATYGTSVSSSSSTYADTGLTATITPTSASNKILVLVGQSDCGKETNNTYLGLRLMRGATEIAKIAGQAAYTGNNTLNYVGSLSINYEDSPATTSATTYKTQLNSGANNATTYVQGSNSLSTITLMEITP
jgi:hypothetical protein